jgi:hypothetical protein
LRLLLLLLLYAQVQKGKSPFSFPVGVRPLVADHVQTAKQVHVSLARGLVWKLQEGDTVMYEQEKCVFLQVVRKIQHPSMKATVEFDVWSPSKGELRDVTSNHLSASVEVTHAGGDELCQCCCLPVLDASHPFAPCRC